MRASGTVSPMRIRRKGSTPLTRYSLIHSPAYMKLAAQTRLIGLLLTIAILVAVVVGVRESGSVVALM